MNGGESMKFRHENKYKVNLCDLLIIKSRLKQFAQLDSHSGADGAYTVKSLYFDNYLDTALREKTDGVSRREKFRIRFYDNDTSFIRLEKKSKINNLSSKESVGISEDECRKIINGDIDFLLKSPSPLLRELYAKMKFRLLRPRSIVVYKRQCYIYPSGNVRITFDTNIRGSCSVTEFLSPEISLLPMCSHSILEVKWDEYLPEIIKKSVSLNARQHTAFSKYAAVRG